MRPVNDLKAEEARTDRAYQVHQALTECGFKHGGITVDNNDLRNVRVYLERDTAWTYDVLARVAEAVGTTDMKFHWDGGGPGGDLTPPSPDEVWIDIRLPE